MIKRPRLDIKIFELALNNAGLDPYELEIIEHIRYIGIFDELSLRKSLALPAKPPALYRLNKACQKIAAQLPQQAQLLMEWSAGQSPDQISWTGNLVCSIGFNADGERLEPESGTVLYHTFVIHKELFNGLGDD
jgi:hypothetical protein